MKNILGLLAFGNPSVGAFNNRPAVAARDDVHTTLPTGSQISIDGVLIHNNGRVLFTHLSDPALNNRVYTAAHSQNPQQGVSWKLDVDAPSTTGEVKLGDILFVNDGNSFGQFLFCWDGEVWQNLNAAVVATVNLGGLLTASSVGTVVKKMEVFDANGNSVGYVPVFDTID
jgi:hypothetical protein